MSKTIVITGASSGFGALSARALADAGHTVYAGMRDSAGRNAPAVTAAKHYAAENESTCAPSSLTSRRSTRSTRPSRPSSTSRAASTC